MSPRIVRVQVHGRACGFLRRLQSVGKPRPAHMRARHVSPREWLRHGILWSSLDEPFGFWSSNCRFTFAHARYVRHGAHYMIPGMQRGSAAFASTR